MKKNVGGVRGARRRHAIEIAMIDFFQRKIA